MAKLITTSLINSVDWYKTCPSSWKEKAWDDLKNQLNRVYSSELPDPIKWGIEFEKKVELDNHRRMHMPEYKIKGSPTYFEVLRVVKGGDFQKKVKKNVTIDGVEYCLFGKIDVFFPDLIIDLKTTGKYTKGKYLKTTQHLIYCYCTQIKTFKYVIVEWDQYPKIKNLTYETFHMESIKQTEEKLFAKIRETIAFIRSDNSLFKAYNETFSKYG